MAENSENIEAKLCAYVEGDLDDAGRVEIERHLEVHPNHRRLLHELMATRDLLRFLPREQAPPELAESFNAQLERSALLDGAGVDADGSDAQVYRANLIPRLMAMAAIVLLAVGLGSVVYFALPRGESGTRLAMPTTTNTRPVAIDDRDAFARRDEAPVAAAVPAPGPVVSRERMGKIGPPMSPGEESIAAKGAPDVDANRVFGGPRGRAAGGGGGQQLQQDPVYVIVSADNLDDALREVTDNLSQNGFRWEPAAEPAPEPINLRENQVAVTAPRGGRAYARLELDNAMQKKAAYGQQRQQLGQQQQRQLQPAQQPQEFAYGGAKDDGSAGVTGDLNAQQSPAAAAPAEVAQATPGEQRVATSAPAAVASAGTEAKFKGGLDDRVASNTVQPSPEADAIVQAEKAFGAAGPATGPAGDMIATDIDVAGVVAYGMTPRQVVELSRMLNRAPQAVEVIADNEELQIANESLRQEQEQQQLAQAAPAHEFAEEPAEPSQPTDRIAAAKGAAPMLDESTADLAKRETADAPAAAPATPAPANDPKVDAGQVAAKPSAPSAPPARSGGAAMKEGAPPAPGAANADEATRQQAQRRTASPALAQRPESEVKQQQPADAGGFGGTGAATRPREPYMARQGAGRPSAIRKGERLSVTVDELAGPDLGSTHAATVAPDGTIRLPKLEQPVAVEGLSRAEAEAKIADAYKTAQVIDAPNVSVEPVLAPPPVRVSKAGEPARVDKAERQQQIAAAPAEVPTTAPSAANAQAEQRSAAAATTTQATELEAATGTTQPADEEQRLNVVILVQKTSAATTSSSVPLDGESSPDDAPATVQEPASDVNAAEPAPAQPAQE